MPIQTIAESDLRYSLISYDKSGRERTDDPDPASGRLSEAVLDEVTTQPVTDVFLMSHGWQGDVPAAIEQYNDWAGAMATCTADVARMREARPSFRPLLIGLHWPSLPWGEEELGGEVSFGASEEEAPDPMASAEEGVADTPPAREALAQIFNAADDDIAPDRLPQEVVDAYQVLFDEAGLSYAGPNAAPGPTRRLSIRKPCCGRHRRGGSLFRSERVRRSSGAAPCALFLANEEARPNVR